MVLVCMTTEVSPFCQVSERVVTVRVTLQADSPKAAPKASPKPETKPAAPAAAAGSTLIKAPMAGTIVKVNVTAGQSVRKGDVVAVLEAMKMENEILAPVDGTVASVNVNKGASVKADDLIASLK